MLFLSGDKNLAKRPEVRKKISESHKGKSTYWLKGKPRSKEIKQKISESLRGIKPKNLQQWIEAGKKYRFQMGERHYEEYLTNWTKTLRRAIRERDKYTCQLCGELQSDRAFSVHHIDYNKKNCNPENLITLCVKCHGKTNHYRSYWINYFK